MVRSRLKENSPNTRIRYQVYIDLEGQEVIASQWVSWTVAEDVARKLLAALTPAEGWKVDASKVWAKDDRGKVWQSFTKPAVKTITAIQPEGIKLAESLGLRAA